MSTFTASGNWASGLPGVAITGDVRFQRLGLTSEVPPDVPGVLVAGVLKRLTGETGILLPAPLAGVEVAGSNGGPYTVTFVNALGKQNVAQLTATASLTGGTAPGVSIATTSAGTPSADEVQTVTITGGPTGGTFTLTFNGQTTSALNYNATALQVQAALQALSNVGAGAAALYWADFKNLKVDGFTVEPVRFLFKGAAANGAVDLAALKADLVAAVAA